MALFGDIYRGKSVLLTGHTGFKGSWLALWLTEMGANVTGISLSNVSDPSHWDLLSLDIPDIRLDIRDTDALRDAVVNAQPDIVFHLAAQPLVRRSYRDPLETWTTNVIGTANVLDACRCSPSVKAIMVVTTDKCYENQEWEWGYREIDRLGGHDPYSASKAGAELVAASYRKSFFCEPDSPLLATTRAGNVVGGGDWSEDRLIPDLVRSISSREIMDIRSPNATRPWQHVLESLSGYLLLGEALLRGDREFEGAWNFGPDSFGNRTVEAVLRQIQCDWPEVSWNMSKGSHPHEAGLLQLDCSKAKQKLGWLPVWSWEQGIQATSEWYRCYLEDELVISRSQLSSYLKAASAAGMTWCH